jgi:hypothetical protein
MYVKLTSNASSIKNTLMVFVKYSSLCVYIYIYVYIYSNVDLYECFYTICIYKSITYVRIHTYKLIFIYPYKNVDICEMRYRESNF